MQRVDSCYHRSRYLSPARAGHHLYWHCMEGWDCPNRRNTSSWLQRQRAESSHSIYCALLCSCPTCCAWVPAQKPMTLRRAQTMVFKQCMWLLRGHTYCQLRAVGDNCLCRAFMISGYVQHIESLHVVIFGLGLSCCRPIIHSAACQCHLVVSL